MDTISLQIYYLNNSQFPNFQTRYEMKLDILGYEWNMSCSENKSHLACQHAGTPVLCERRKNTQN